jgi:hypothetical protein
MPPRPRVGSICEAAEPLGAARPDCQIDGANDTKVGGEPGSPNFVPKQAPQRALEALYRRPAVRTERLLNAVLGATTYNCFNGTCCDKPCNPASPCPTPHLKACP